MKYLKKFEAASWVEDVIPKSEFDQTPIKDILMELKEYGYSFEISNNFRNKEFKSISKKADINESQFYFSYDINISDNTPHKNVKEFIEKSNAINNIANRLDNEYKIIIRDQSSRGYVIICLDVEKRLTKSMVYQGLPQRGPGRKSKGRVRGLDFYESKLDQHPQILDSEIISATNPETKKIEDQIRIYPKIEIERLRSILNSNFSKDIKLDFIKIIDDFKLDWVVDEVDGDRSFEKIPCLRLILLQ